MQKKRKNIWSVFARVYVCVCIWISTMIIFSASFSYIFGLPCLFGHHETHFSNSRTFLFFSSHLRPAELNEIKQNENLRKKNSDWYNVCFHAYSCNYVLMPGFCFLSITLFLLPLRFFLLHFLKWTFFGTRK